VIIKIVEDVEKRLKMKEVGKIVFSWNLFDPAIF
jgi:hypothetical protein